MAASMSPSSQEFGVGDRDAAAALRTADAASNGGGEISIQVICSGRSKTVRINDHFRAKFGPITGQKPNAWNGKILAYSMLPPKNLQKILAIWAKLSPASGQIHDDCRSIRPENGWEWRAVEFAG
jgi:hypothetical protein